MILGNISLDELDTDEDFEAMFKGDDSLIDGLADGDNANYKPFQEQ